MAPDPAPPPIVLAIPVPPPPPISSSLSLNPDPPTISSDQSLAPPVVAGPSPVLAPPPAVQSGSAPVSSASPTSHLGGDLSRREPPADLLCFPSLLPPPRSFEPPSCHQLPSAPEPPSAAPEPPTAAPEPPPTAPTASADSSAIPPLPSSLLHPPADALLAAHPAILQHHPPPVRRNASLSSVAEPLSAVLSETAAPPSSAFPPLPSILPKRPHQADAPLPGQPSDIQHRIPPVRHNAQANPLQPKSYAQATKGSPGPGFVRAHARDIDSFARLPRTGINAIRGSREGVPTFAIAQSDLPIVEGLYAKALVMKFHGGRPSLAASHKEISNWGLESPFSIGPLSSRSFLLRFQNERDLLKTLTRPFSTLIKFPYKIFRWHSRCHIKEESCVVPIWISLPRLPLHFFAPELLESIANSIGRFLCLDKATATLARPSEARMCVELDLRKERLQFIWIDLFEGLKQPIVYERVPKFCIGCQVQGHTHVECSKSPLDTLQPQDPGPLPAVQECPQLVRRNAKEMSDAISHANPHPSRASSFAAATDPLLTSDLSQQDLRQPIIAAVSSEQQLCVPLPLPPPPLEPAPPDPAQQLPAVQPFLQSSVAAAPLPPSAPQQDPHDPYHQQLHPPPISPVINSSEQQSMADPYASLPLHPPPSQQALFAAASNLPASHPVLQPSVADSSHKTLPPSHSNARANSFSHPVPAAAPPIAQDLLPAAAAPHTAPTPPSEAQQVSSASPESAPAAAHSQAQSLSAQAAPFSPSDPGQSVQQSSTNNKQPSTSSLRVQSNFEKYNIRCVMPPESHPNRGLWEMLNRSIGEQNGGIYALMNAPTPSNFSRQNQLFEGIESEGSFETDSQQNSPVESTHEYVNQSLPLQCASEGENLDEEPPGFQGHISDVAFYQRPMSSKKNKRQPDGPLRVQLRTRKGPSKHK